ncbi:hypothetical protein G6F32_015138 [Rhizopus arrhizus]|nr:hypothetical protein G6F32_015138 [Rhizopus arrhizus]
MRWRGATVPRADPARWAGDRYRSGSQPLLHDHPGGLPADPAGGGVGIARCDLYPRHGRAGADPRAGRTDDPPGRQAAVQGHSDHLYRPAPGREAARDAVLFGRGLSFNRAPEDSRGRRAHVLARPGAG